MTRTPHVYDCFTFSSELDLLEFRLDLLAPVVHRFVIVEAPRTHSGLDKPLLFEEHRARFDRHLDKIIHIVVDDLPAPQPDRWVPEVFQRDAILRGLVDADPGDIALVTDVDEIPDPAVVERLKDETFESLVLEMRMCFYAGNWESTSPWSLARAARVDSLSSPNDLRSTTPLLRVPDGGCHLSYLMQPTEIVRKYEWFAHAELDQSIHRSMSYIESMITLGIVAPTGDVLTMRTREEIGPVQEQLLRRSPQFFTFAAPSTNLRKIGSGWRRLRARPSLPTSVVQGGDAMLARLLSRTTEAMRHG